MENTAKKLKTISVMAFAKENGLVKIEPKVMKNTNGYPCVIFKDRDNNDTWVYFSKSAAEKVEVDQPITAEMLKAHMVGFTTNAQGEERIKLVSATEALDLETLLG